MEEGKIIQLGKCPYCKGEDYESSYSEMVADYDIPYVVFDCNCNKCDKIFTEYFSLDEVKFDSDNDDEENIYATSTLGKEEKETLTKALNLLVETEEDQKDYSQIFDKLKGELKAYN